MGEPDTIVTGVIGIDDPHIIGHKLLSLLLEDNGFRVVSIGAKCAPEEFVKAAIETDASAIAVSSLAGHAEDICRDLRKLCEEAGLEEIPLYIGGNLVIGMQDWGVTEKKFKEMGFNRVYPPSGGLSEVVGHLRQDLGNRKRKKVVST